MFLVSSANNSERMQWLVTVYISLCLKVMSMWSFTCSCLNSLCIIRMQFKTIILDLHYAFCWRYKYYNFWCCCVTHLWICSHVSLNPLLVKMLPHTLRVRRLATLNSLPGRTFSGYVTMKRLQMCQNYDLLRCLISVFTMWREEAYRMYIVAFTFTLSSWFKISPPHIINLCIYELCIVQ